MTGGMTEVLYSFTKDIGLVVGSLLGKHRPLESITQAQHEVEQVTNLPTMAKQLPPEMEKMVSEASLSEYVKNDVRELLSCHVDTFALPGEPACRTSLVRHAINTGISAPITQKARNIPAVQIPLYEEDEGIGCD